MRIEVNTIEEFFTELEVEAQADHVHNRVLRMRVDQIPEQEQEVTFFKILWLTAVVEKGEALLELGMKIGTSTRHGDGPGDVVEREIREAVKNECAKLGLTLRHGKIEKY